MKLRKLSTFYSIRFDNNLLDVKYTINIVDLIFDNCYIIDRSNNWSLLLFKEAYHIRRCDPSLNHGARASKELTILNDASKLWNS